MSVLLVLTTATSFARTDEECEARLGPTHRRIYFNVKAPLTYLDGEPYVTVYRGLRDLWRPDYRNLAFGEWMYTTLDSEVALDYFVRGPIFRAATRVALMRMRLPLRYAHVARRRSEKDDYRPVEKQRALDWLFWSARVRRREREIVFNLQEVGPLTNPAYDLRVIERELPEVSSFAWSTGFEQVAAAQASIRQSMAADEWRPLVAPVE